MSDAVKVLRKEIARSKIEEGTVVRFDRTLTTRWDEMSRRAFEVEETTAEPTFKQTAKAAKPAPAPAAESTDEVIFGVSDVALTQQGHRFSSPQKPVAQLLDR